MVDIKTIFDYVATIEGLILSIGSAQEEFALEKAKRLKADCDTKIVLFSAALAAYISEQECDGKTVPAQLEAASDYLHDMGMHRDAAQKFVLAGKDGNAIQEIKAASACLSTALDLVKECR